MLSGPLALGAVGACTMLFPRVAIAASVLNLSVAKALLPYLVVPFAVGIITLYLWWRTNTDAVGPADMPSNPLQIVPALQMAVVFQVVLFAVSGVRYFFGERGLLFSGAVLGLTDVDALTISMAQTAGAGVAAEGPARAIAAGILMNCLLKMGLAVALGSDQFRRVTSVTLAAMSVTLAVLLGVLR